VYRLEPIRLPAETATLRGEIRGFLGRLRRAGRFVPICDGWVRGADRGFSRLLGAQGWLGMTWPKRYGGQERPQHDRFVVIEELLAAGAPVASHWVAERQIGPTLLKHGTEAQKERLVPPIARGEAVVAVGYSEPDVGSDLAAVQTRAVRADAGWRLSGAKIWTSQAHDADWMTVLCRTAPAEGDKRKGLSLLLVMLPAEGVTIRPIQLLNGEHHFNAVTFDEVFVPDAMVLGEVGRGWRIVTEDLAYERSGPERYMSTFPLLAALVDRAAAGTDPGAAVAIGRLVARFQSLRAMSVAVAQMLERGESPTIEAALVKDIGTRFESEVAEVAREVCPVLPDLGSGEAYARLLGEAVLQAPAFTLRGGTNEVLRGIVARGLGLR
jgi:alkylation response protein AidB-like acyl-CoA dehydrogenase